MMIITMIMTKKLVIWRIRMVMSSIDENIQCKIANTPPLSYLICVH